MARHGNPNGWPMSEPVVITEVTVLCAKLVVTFSSLLLAAAAFAYVNNQHSL
jgi:hypothetical protein